MKRCLDLSDLVHKQGPAIKAAPTFECHAFAARMQSSQTAHDHPRKHAISQRAHAFAVMNREPTILQRSRESMAPKDLTCRDDMANRLSDDFGGALGLGGRDIEMGAGPNRLRTRKVDEHAALPQGVGYVFRSP